MIITSELATAVVDLGRLALRFGLVERGTFHPDGVTPETDTTHTVMLAVVGCALAERHLPDLDRGRVAEFVLVSCLAQVRCLGHGHVLSEEWRRCRCEGRIAGHKEGGCPEIRDCERPGGCDYRERRTSAGERVAT